MSWIRLPVKVQDPTSLPEHLHSRNVRFKFLMQYLERNPEEATFFAATLQEFLERGLAIRLYCLTGVSENNHFFSELTDRIIHKTIPLVYAENDLAEVFQAIFTEVEDAEWFEECYQVILPPLLSFIGQHGIRTEELKNDLKDAMIILTSQISSIGTSREIRRRLTERNLASSNFVKLGQAVFKEGQSDNAILQEISHCRIHLGTLKSNLETSGVSVDLIYQIEKLHARLDRLEMLIYLRQSEHPQTKAVIISQFVGRLIRDEISRTGIREFLHENLQMITKKVVERTGEKGDHYIANTQEERQDLLVAGAWAGILTGFTTLVKIAVGKLQLPYLLEGIAFFFNYAVSFLLMQKYHMALSSKLPAYTASALSKKFEDFIQTKELSEVVSEVKKIIKSQTLAAFSNLLWVAPVAILIDWLWFFSFDRHVYSRLQALNAITKHDIFNSGTVFYAFITGIFLWLSSVIGGAVENWLVFRHFPQLLRETPLMHRILGRERLLHFAKHFPAVMGGMAGNLAIAAFLATPIVIGKITGIPLDIRHVTLSSGAITFAFNSLQWDFAYWPQMLSMLLSIFVMGTLNFGVSFYCAVRMAAIARNVENKYLKVIFRFALFGSAKTKPSSTESPE